MLGDFINCAISFFDVSIKIECLFMKFKGNKKIVSLFRERERELRRKKEIRR